MHSFALRLARWLLLGAVAFVLSVPAARCATNEECLACHSAEGFSTTGKDGKQVSLHVDGAAFQSSIHGRRKCVDCHVDLIGQPFPHKTNVAPVDCTRCHHKGNTQGAPDISPMDGYRDSVHGKAAAAGDKDAPSCKNCHGYHDVRSPSDPKSSTYHKNIPGTCAKCHANPRIIKDHKLPADEPVRLYQGSVHGKLVASWNLSAAVCTDCHGVHDIKAPRQADSSVNREMIPETCGKCHPDVYEQYKQSIHGIAKAKGVKDAPVCTDCHGEHTIQKPTTETSSVYPTHVVKTCSKCHENVRLQRTYGLPANRLASYIGSFHGVANKYGETTVANCATCHTAHSILPSKDPRSSVNKKNLPQTCGKCHPGANRNFAIGDIHVVPSLSHDRVVFFVRTMYSVFVFGMIASFVGYIGLDLLYRRRRGGRTGDTE